MDAPFTDLTMESRQLFKDAYILILLNFLDHFAALVMTTIRSPSFPHALSGNLSRN